MSEAPITGRLEKVEVAVGGETTGYVLRKVVLDADMSAIRDKDQHLGKRVKVQGSFEVRDRITGGPTWIFNADRLVAVDDAPAVAPPGREETPEIEDAQIPEVEGEVREGLPFQPEAVRQPTSVEQEAPIWVAYCRERLMWRGRGNIYANWSTTITEACHKEFNSHFLNSAAIVSKRRIGRCGGSGDVIVEARYR